jgi:hypothetical protein
MAGRGTSRTKGIRFWPDFLVHWKSYAEKGGYPERSSRAIAHKIRELERQDLYRISQGPCAESMASAPPPPPAPQPSPEKTTADSEGGEAALPLEEFNSENGEAASPVDEMEMEKEIVGEAVGTTSPRAVKTGDLKEKIMYGRKTRPAKAVTHTALIPKKPCLADIPEYCALKARYGQTMPKVKRLKPDQRAPVKNLDKVPKKWWKLGNAIIRTHVKRAKNLKQLHNVIYAMGKALENLAGDSRQERADARDKWVKSRQSEEKCLRMHIGWLTVELDNRRNRRKPTKRQLCNLSKLKWAYRVKVKKLEKPSATATLEALLERLKMRVKLISSYRAYDERLAQTRYMKSVKLRNVLEDPPTGEAKVKAEVARDYWAGIVGKSRKFKRTEALIHWEAELESSIREIPSAPSLSKKHAWWQSTVRKASPFKATGPDGIPNVLWKRLTSAQLRLRNWLLKKDRKKFPKWLARGRITLLPKAGDLTLPENYRPIACLNASYKLITGYISQELSEHLSRYQIIPWNQRALRKGAQGCLDASVLDRALTIAAERGKETLSTAWVDYSKAFDSVPHGYLRFVLRAAKVPAYIRHAIAGLMRKWRVHYEVRTSAGLTKSRTLRVRNGVLQGDTLSPMAFCLAIAPVSHMLNKLSMHAVEMTGKSGRGTLEVNHLLYMDDLKLYDRDEESLDLKIEELRTLSLSIGLSMNIKKCAKASLNKTTLPEGDTETGIPTLGAKSTYKYLGIQQRFRACFEESWSDACAKIMARVKKLLNSAMTFGQMRTAFNTAVVPVANYLFSNLIAAEVGFRTLNARAIALDDKIRALMREDTLFAHSNVERSYLPVREGGLGLKSFADALEESVLRSYAYIECTEETGFEFIRLILSQENVKKTVYTAAKSILKRYGKSADGIVHPPERTKAGRKLASIARQAIEQQRKQTWLSKPMAARVPLDRYVHKDSFLWLRHGAMKPRTVKNALAIQEGILNSSSREEGSWKSCRRCKSAPETDEHIVSVCNWQKAGLMLERHNHAVNVIHHKLSLRYRLPITHCSSPVHSVLENEYCKLLYDVPLETKSVRTELVDGVAELRTIRFNRPDLVVFDKKGKHILIIEVGISWFNRMESMEAIKLHKYSTNSCAENERELATPLTRKTGPNLRMLLGEMYGAEYINGVEVIPLVIGTCGEVSANTIGHLNRILNCSRKQAERTLIRLQQAAIVGTSRIARAHLCASS